MASRCATSMSNLIISYLLKLNECEDRDQTLTMEEVRRSNKESNIVPDKNKNSKYFVPTKLDPIKPKVSLISWSI